MKYLKSATAYAKRHGPGVARTVWREVGRPLWREVGQPLMIHHAKKYALANLM